MKKILLSLLLLSAGSVMAYTGTCNGGFTLTGKQNGHVYCVSAAVMNWWSALAWCQSQNSQLADFSVICPNSSMTNTTGACSNMQHGMSGQGGWTSSTNNGSDAVNISLNTGAVNWGNYHRTDQNHAICE